MSEKITPNAPQADEKTSKEDIGNVPPSPIVVHKQYLKDLSFENPNAPEILKKSPDRPAMEMNILIDVQKLEEPEIEHFYEVTLNITASAVRHEKTMFLAEVVYAAAVSVQGLEENKHHALLFIEVPQLIFPFARQIISDTTQAGGYTALLVNPVDFRSMYIKRFADKAE